MTRAPDMPMLIDGLQFCRWSRRIFEQMRAARMSAVHATVLYHGGFREALRALTEWNDLFRENADLIAPARSLGDVEAARASGRTAIFFGVQNPMPIEDDLGLVEALHMLGVRFLQLTYNNQSLLGCGWMEATDSGVTRMGREVIREMNRLGMVIDLSHAGERTMLEAIEISQRPVAITHANPFWWRETRRNVSRDVLRALAGSGGMLGLSLYPHHLRDGGETTLASFCAMAAEVAELMGVEQLGIGSDLCQDQPDSVVQWMRAGRWTRDAGGQGAATFPRQPDWFCDIRDFPRLKTGLLAAGFSGRDADFVLGEGWARFLRSALTPAAGAESRPVASDNSQATIHQ